MYELNSKRIHFMMINAFIIQLDHAARLIKTLVFPGAQEKKIFLFVIFCFVYLAHVDQNKVKHQNCCYQLLGRKIAIKLDQVNYFQFNQWHTLHHTYIILLCMDNLAHVSWSFQITSRILACCKSTNLIQIGNWIERFNFNVWRKREHRSLLRTLKIIT